MRSRGKSYALALFPPSFLETEMLTTNLLQCHSWFILKLLGHQKLCSCYGGTEKTTKEPVQEARFQPSQQPLRPNGKKFGERQNRLEVCFITNTSSFPAGHDCFGSTIMFRCFLGHLTRVDNFLAFLIFFNRLSSFCPAFMLGNGDGQAVVL